MYSLNDQAEPDRGTPSLILCFVDGHNYADLNRFSPVNMIQLGIMKTSGHRRNCQDIIFEELFV